MSIQVRHVFHRDTASGLALVRLSGQWCGIIETDVHGREVLVKRGRAIGVLLNAYRRATGNHRITLQE
jgi:hypothetical protein